MRGQAMLELVDESGFLGAVLASGVNRAVLERAPLLGVLPGRSKGRGWLSGAQSGPPAGRCLGRSLRKGSTLFA